MKYSQFLRIPTLIPRIPTQVTSIPSPIPRILTQIPHIYIHILRIPIIPFPDSPLRFLHIAVSFIGQW